jgi:hypothetical protein
MERHAVVVDLDQVGGAAPKSTLNGRGETAPPHSERDSTVLLANGAREMRLTRMPVSIVAWCVLFSTENRILFVAGHPPEEVTQAARVRT